MSRIPPPPPPHTHIRMYTLVVQDDGDSMAYKAEDGSGSMTQVGVHALGWGLLKEEGGGCRAGIDLPSRAHEESGVPVSWSAVHGVQHNGEFVPGHHLSRCWFRSGNAGAGLLLPAVKQAPPTRFSPPSPTAHPHDPSPALDVRFQTAPTRVGPTRHTHTHLLRCPLLAPPTAVPLVA